jgi:hypothetical protein
MAAKPIGTLGAQSYIGMANVQLVDDGNVIMLYARMSSSGTNIYTTFRKMGDTAATGFAIPNGKTLKIYAIRMFNDANGSFGRGASIFRQTNDAGSSPTTTVPTGVINLIDGTTSTSVFMQVSITATGVAEAPFVASVVGSGTTQYIGLSNIGNTNAGDVYLLCRLVDT